MSAVSVFRRGSMQNVNEDRKEGTLTAKTISKVFKFIAPSFVVLFAVLKWCGVFAGAEMDEIIKVGFFIYASGAGTIDLNIIFDKFTGRE